MDQNFPDGVMRKLHIHGNKQQVEAAIAEVEFLMKSAPVNSPRPGKTGPEVGKVGKRRYLNMFVRFICYRFKLALTAFVPRLNGGEFIMSYFEEQE